MRPRAMRICEACGKAFPPRVVIDGKVRSLYSRRFCLECSPFGSHNTSKTAPGTVPLPELVERRRKKRNAKTYRCQKRRRLRWKKDLIASRGGRCVDCGYSACLAALEFHHRNPATKDFTLANFSGSYARFLEEADKCDLVCASCHRIRHSPSETETVVDPVVRHRRKRKTRAVLYMGQTCEGCGRDGPATLFEFHHRNARAKDFGLSESGIPHSWEKTVAELAKCVMLCANCHREVHAGVRQLEDEALLGLAETAGGYAHPLAARPSTEARVA